MPFKEFLKCLQRVLICVASRCVFLAFSVTVSFAQVHLPDILPIFLVGSDAVLLHPRVYEVGDAAFGVVQPVKLVPHLHTEPYVDCAFQCFPRQFWQVVVGAWVLVLEARYADGHVAVLAGVGQRVRWLLLQKQFEQVGFCRAFLQRDRIAARFVDVPLRKIAFQFKIYEIVHIGFVFSAIKLQIIPLTT